MRLGWSSPEVVVPMSALAVHAARAEQEARSVAR
jgi:hypothetical protein